uniref:Uncharacterized protein n=1 Tax=Rhizobium leguminosarum TaxID=384 RepID=A0A179BUA6_RHILE|nr:hypothetical protein A4U53_19260 [Rhizobium leguminosarum]
MEDAKNTDSIFMHSIRGDIRRAWDHQLPCARDSSWPSAFREFDKATNSNDDFLVNMDSRPWIIGLNICENILSVG